MLIHLDIKLLYILSPGIGKIMGEGIAVAQSLPGCLVPSLRNCLPSCGVSSHFCAKSTKTSLSCSLIALLFSCSHLSAECASVCLTSSVPIPGQPHSEGKECSCTRPPSTPVARSQHAHAVGWPRQLRWCRLRTGDLRRPF